MKKNDVETNQPRPSELIEHISQCVICIDLAGKVIYWNRASERIFGYSRDEMLNKPLLKIYPFITEEEFFQNLDKLNAGQEVQGQWKGITKDGTLIWIDAHAEPIFDDSGKPKAIVASAHDISELKEIEQELEENKAKAQAILETTIDGIITVDENKKILSFNHAAERIFGYSENEIIGKNINILMPEPYSSQYERHINGQINTEGQKTIGKRQELTGLRKDGTKFPIELSVSEVRWKETRIFTSVVNDISERRRLEKEILRISEEERRNLGQDLHDGLGQMLTGISLISKNLAQKLKANGISGADEVQEIAELTKEADEYAKSLAHGLVQIDIEKEGLMAALKQLSTQTKRLFDIDCTVINEDQVSINNNLQGIHLYRIAQEAISNAIKHGKAKKIEIRLSADKEKLQLVIKDDGVGFSESQKKKEKNAGIGIHIMCYRANILSGRLHITETEDGKTKVICQIPYNT